MAELRWGVLGVANIAVRAVIPAIHAAANARLVAIASRSTTRAQDAAARLGVLRAHGSYEALLADHDVDAVYIPLPNALHLEWTVRCAEAGKHVLCEKPLALTAADGEAMIAACRRRGVVLVEAFMYRFHPRTRRAAQLVAEGAVGDPRLVRAAFTFALRSRDNIRLQADLGGGSLYDVGCYAVNVSRLMLGEPHAAFAFGQIGPSGVDEVLGGLLQFDGGRVALIDCALTLPRRQEYEVVGSRGRLVVPVAFLPGTADAEIRLTRDEEPSVITVSGVDQYRLMVEQFGEAVLNGAPPLLPPEDAVANLRVIEALFRSLRGGRAEPVTPAAS
ncbi:MAG: Gfo/Idh/MocA family oxidoreductase [Armatimonadota bacterium]|nr:Gfo/Idh/MocA family oxidoreductase [Armatimonadota bacterium]